MAIGCAVYLASWEAGDLPMAQSSRMSTREIVQTARPIVKLGELIRMASSDTEMAQHLFMTDLLKVGLLVANADGVISERERFAMISVTSLIQYAAYAELLRWDSMEEFEREMYEETCTNLCDIARDDGVENLQYLVALQDVAQAKRGPLMSKLADAIYGFAHLVAKADGTVTSEEQTQLDRLRARLDGHSPTSRSQPDETSAVELAGVVTEQPIGRSDGRQRPAAQSLGSSLDPDSRRLAIGTLVTLLAQLSEANLHELISHARRLAGTD
jgi:tellurite resistance protein